jgi:hypothetical protein
LRGCGFKVLVEPGPVPDFHDHIFSYTIGHYLSDGIGPPGEILKLHDFSRRTEDVLGYLKAYWTMGTCTEPLCELNRVTKNTPNKLRVSI